MTQTFSISEVADAKAAGWMVVKENVIAGKVRTVVMEKEGNPLAWLEEETRAKKERRAGYTKVQMRMAMNRDRLKNRGMDV